MNLLKGRIEDTSGSPTFRLSPDIVLPLPRAFAGSTDSEAIYGIRPEYVTITEQGNGFPSQVVVVEPLGPETQITLSAGGHTIVAVSRARTSLQPDETVWIRPEIDHVRLFGLHGRRLAV
jgi:multiple sugar transport system ATP-binding protein